MGPPSTSCRKPTINLNTIAINMIIIKNKKSKIDKMQQDYPNTPIIDLTSTSEDLAFRVLSPFYPHQDEQGYPIIPIPFSNGTAFSVEGIWQGLKVFENTGIDFSCFANCSMQGLKRTERVYGKTLGHSRGVDGYDLLDYFTARMLIYLPSYLWVMLNVPSAQAAVNKIRELSSMGDVILLDYNTNDNFRDISKPLSHAGLVKLFIEGNYPDPAVGVNGYRPLTYEEAQAYHLQRKAEDKQYRQLLKKRRTAKTSNAHSDYMDMALLTNAAMESNAAIYYGNATSVSLEDTNARARPQKTAAAPHQLSMLDDIESN